MGIDNDGHSQSREQTLDPIGVRSPLGLQLNSLAVKLAAIFLFDTGDGDDRPDFMLPEIPADQHRDKLASVETIGFSASLASVDLNARRVDDDVTDARVNEVVIQPEAVTAGLVAGDDLDAFGKTKSFLGSQD